MIQIELHMRPNGTLQYLSALGHAVRPHDDTFSPACAAVSSALRSTARLLAATSGIEVSGEAPEEGVFRLELHSCSFIRRRYLRGVSAALLQILLDLAMENPTEVQVELR
ncbi:MAG: hypothetical protein ABR590_04540 [Spirochaetia bacterium]